VVTERSHCKISQPIGDKFGGIAPIGIQNNSGLDFTEQQHITVTSTGNSYRMTTACNSTLGGATIFNELTVTAGSTKKFT
jgi:hypothetical protein